MVKRDRPTLRTVASMAGLAVTTVSRALSDDPRIAPETRSRVQEIARQIGYSPDRAAQRLRTGRTNVIAFLLNPHEEILGYGSSMIRGLTRALRGTPYHLVVMPNYADRPPAEPIENVLRNRLADGLIISRTRPDDLRVRMMLEHGFPFISHGRTELATPHPFVDFDNFGFAHAAAARLIARGARRPCLIPAPEGMTFAQHLRMGFLRACGEAGIEGQVLSGVTLDDPPQALRAHVLDLIARDALPDGFVCPGEVSAMAVHAACADSGRAGDCHLVMKHTSGMADIIRPRFDSIFEDLTEAGELMGRMLLRAIAGEPPDQLRHLQSAPPLVAGEYPISEAER
ncbi:LacI family transcriptional regulator [Paracoccus siganidrum]|uniref:LacI family DNA-binding transcriptional regulator n=1 Tax=Paracoccus siganidrum TaxID=1276757 RepID=A0A419A4E8_9RHOB|nr:LacI family transcriptional regulator [Paracoccus siganidrum]RJL09638.1 LacI family DNA-binding transcriptional regulator [Paracoccus siganidrum]RMC35848.1 LacI family transcriptional regulator [Paracoccus siganidrum]